MVLLGQAREFHQWYEKDEDERRRGKGRAR
jgi:hypothetical protein